MVLERSVFVCETCGWEHATYGAASECEQKHIVNSVTEKFREEVARIVGEHHPKQSG